MPPQRRSPLLALGLFILSGAAASMGFAQTSPWAGTPQQEFLQGPIVRKFQCVTCHTITDQGGTVGPVLNLVGFRRSEDWIRKWLDNPNTVKPGTKMPKFPFTSGELELAVQFLTGLTRPVRADEILASEGLPVEKGRRLFAEYECSSCHRIGREGRFVGPDLTWVGIRKGEEWERIWLRGPEKVKPGTFMPNFNLAPEAADHLAKYLHTLQGQENEDARAWEFTINMMINNSDVTRGEMVWKRLACWSCHGELGEGGLENPNAAQGHERIPGLLGVRDSETLETFLAKIESGTPVSAASEGLTPRPFSCPAYKNALDDQELGDLYAFVSSLAPPKQRWKIK